ncbi:MAG: group II intron reverse transcriptase/maturase [Proteobacteria bacterium]|nr:group II intron reverse transcriptase/maturase [Pseudomonadota bacterium]
MHVNRKSDKGVVPRKLLNDGIKKISEEKVEGRPLTEGNTEQSATCRTQGRVNVSSGLEGVRKRARLDKDLKFTALLHHVTLFQLMESYSALKPNAKPGVDEMTWKEYGKALANNLQNLYKRIHTGCYRALPSKRCYIPKADGKQRALGVASLEDKIVQHAIATVLNAIYETDFMGFSYGFRPKRSAHDALDAVAMGMKIKRVNWVLDADIQGYFDNINHEWLQRFLRYRIADKRILRLITKWLKAGVLEGDKWEATTKGCPQGSVISPLLSNIYLHYVLDLWVEAYRKREAKGDVLIVRFADDFILGFEHHWEAKKFLTQLKERFNKFGLQLHEQKTKLIQFGRFAVKHCKARADKKPGTFEFLGFVHICSETRIKHNFVVKRQTSKKRMRKTLQAIKSELMKRRHAPVVQTGNWLKKVVQGYFNYFAVPGNLGILNGFRREVCRYWLHSLRRRSQRSRMIWGKLAKLVNIFIPSVKRIHGYPHERFNVRYAQ